MKCPLSDVLLITGINFIELVGSKDVSNPPPSHYFIIKSLVAAFLPYLKVQEADFFCLFKLCSFQISCSFCWDIETIFVELSSRIALGKYYISLRSPVFVKKIKRYMIAICDKCIKNIMEKYI